jgi:hypothetical protein
MGTNVSKKHVGCMFRIEEFTVNVEEGSPEK